MLLNSGPISSGLGRLGWVTKWRFLLPRRRDLYCSLLVGVKSVAALLFDAPKGERRSRPPRAPFSLPPLEDA